ncbi:flagellar basal body P-ring formation protein FlgA [Shewanella sp. 4t3-1-2LB]|uniref:flagellar basal body P-ring formation chaperone FlgA n=1 Tax=Shewanella sp. 4t3-1-2LB TaxID=2817682 RepID=UPI001A983059|nr:flagellar basal body P-ring formation chaperone FlgA [Shewanella sp. 4t3-1-2LB]MBO1272379.1 flagellar basal body P-ring formation protein FlgA [Shewanella sp. 4t3-1-2LB]
MKLKLTSIFISTLLWTTVALAEQPSVPAVSAIEALAKDVVAKKVNAPASARVNITPQPLDSRVAIPRCSSPITAVLASDRDIGRNNTVRISCDSPDLSYPWQIYLSVRVDISYPVVVAKETLAPGDVLSAAQMEIRYVDQYSVNGEQFSDMQQLIGTRLKRRVSKDYPIFGSNICVVCKGDTVSIIARTEQFQIKTVGEAVEDGNLGEQIRVKNTRSNKTVDAIVTHVGEVQVKM